MTTRTPFDPIAAAALFAAGAVDAPIIRSSGPVGSFAYDVTRSADDQIRIAVLPAGWPEEYRPAQVQTKKPVPGRVYH